MDSEEYFYEYEQFVSGILIGETRFIRHHWKQNCLKIVSEQYCPEIVKIIDGRPFEYTLTTFPKTPGGRFD